MSHNFYIPNYTPLQRGISEITNISIPMNMLNFSPTPIQLSPALEAQKMNLGEFPEYCPSSNNWAKGNGIAAPISDSLKENMNLDTINGLGMRDAFKASQKSTDASGSENMDVCSKEEASLQSKK